MLYSNILIIFFLFFFFFFFQLVQQWKEIEETFKECQKEFVEQRAPKDFHRIVCSRRRMEHYSDLQKDLINYLEFQADLGGFWRCLKNIQDKNSSLKGFLMQYANCVVDNDESEDLLSKKRKN
jgi:hypothetical protein